MTSALSHVKARLGVAGLNRPMVDTHVHLWNEADLPAVVAPAIGVRPDLARDFRADHFERIADELGMGGFIVVQARDPNDHGLREAERLNELSGDDARFLGVIAGVDLRMGDEVRSHLEQLRRLDGIKGVRMIAPENEGVGIYGSRAALAAAAHIGESGLLLELLLRSKNPGQMAEVAKFAQTVIHAHNKPMILNHLGKPLGLSDGKPTSDWIDFMTTLGKTRRVYVKLSALRGEMGKNADRRLMFPFFDVALQTFGPSMLLFGSDHPVSFDYGECVLDVVEWILDRGLHVGDIANLIFARNPAEVYQLES